MSDAVVSSVKPAANQDNPLSRAVWQFWIDRGGTFTDVIGVSPKGRLYSHKLLSENPEQYPDAVTAGIAQLLARVNGEAVTLTEAAIDQVKMGTTVATNALLEKKGAKTALLITQGLGDQLRIGFQTRPDIFALRIEPPRSLYETVVEVPERLDAEGQVLKALDKDAVQKTLAALRQQGFEALAVVFMHAYLNPSHELAIAELAKTLGFRQISLSHQVSPQIKLVWRGDTAVLDAYTSPVLKDYVARCRQRLPKATELLLMQSNGGLLNAAEVRGKDAILSGPAGGIVGMVKTAELEGFSQLIGFDMGGTSTDVSHYQGSYERHYETQVGGYRLRSPIMNIHTVAAGGGSCLKYQAGRFQVGPESAGANPGPAAYRRGGPLTVTDANLLLGKIPLDEFPRVFGPKGDQGPDLEAVRGQFASLADDIQCSDINPVASQSASAGANQTRSLEDIAEGFIAVAVENMANAIKKIAVQRGYAVQDYVLCAFGGAGGQHACRVAEALGMQTVLIQKYAGVLSALGMGLAQQSLFTEKAWLVELSPALWPQLQSQQQTLQATHSQQLLAKANQMAGATALEVCHQTRLSLRYQGTDFAIEVDFQAYQPLIAEFTQAFEQLYGYRQSGRLELVALTVQSSLKDERNLRLLSAQALEDEGQSLRADPTNMANQVGAENPAQPCGQQRLYSAGAWHRADLYRLAELAAGQSLKGPAIILDPNSTLVLEPGWRAQKTALGNLLMQRFGAHDLNEANGFKAAGAQEHPDKKPNVPIPCERADPVWLEIINSRFMSIAEQMGAVLEKTAVSVNIKERLDFSCAIFDKQGQLIANAPHIPVHLGSMGASVRAVMEKFTVQSMRPGDQFVTNNPYAGGTHLPDITLIKPVFSGAGELLFFTAARGHHADIGGISPGSMPANSRHIDQEGVLLDNLKLISAGEFDRAGLLSALSQATYPARNPEQNILDLQAQAAACETGARGLLAMLDELGKTSVQAYMAFALDNAEQAVRGLIERLPAHSQISNAFDQGEQICIELHKTADALGRAGMCIDFTGTSAVVAGNFNAPLSICRAAVLYVFRCLIQQPIPLNEGIFRALDIRVPKDCLLNPSYPAAVVAGNVETAQHLVNSLLLALGRQAESQGTNNNLTFGNQRYQYYETLCGGSGAGLRQSPEGELKGFAGADAVHTHMTNSRLTDPEILETRLPVRLERFAIRSGSGGAGAFPGGNGVIRRLRFLQPMSAAILSSHRQSPTLGLNGGGPGQAGANWLIKADGRRKLLRGCDQLDLEAGDQLEIHTPGGAGCGGK